MSAEMQSLPPEAQSVQPSPAPLTIVPPVDGELARQRRERSRELHSAAQRLAFEDPLHTAHARAVLHRDGALEALRALTADPEDQLLSSATSKGLLTDAEALALQPSSSTSVDTLSALHLRLLEKSEAEERLARAATLRAWQIRGTLAIAGTALALILSWVAYALAKPVNLAQGKAWRTSSVGLECKPREHKCGNTRTDIFFHTNNELEPWFEIDLGAPTTFTWMTINNRMDMGVARASPLVVEVTDDRQTWREVARNQETFLTWTPRFAAVTARYVRLRVLKKTWFHLEAVEVHP